MNVEELWSANGSDRNIRLMGITGGRFEGCNLLINGERRQLGKTEVWVLPDLDTSMFHWQDCTFSWTQ